MIHDARRIGDSKLVERLREARVKCAEEMAAIPAAHVNLTCEAGVVRVQCSVGPTKVPDEETYAEYLLTSMAMPLAGAGMVYAI